MRALRKRLQEVQSGDSSAATELYRLMTKDDPGTMIVDFLRSSSPMAIEAMQTTVVSFLGTLPKQFGVAISTTAERFAALSYQLQMTGYLFRNAEYIIVLRRLLSIQAANEEELRAAFGKIDKDGSGFIEVAELKIFLEQWKGGAVKVNSTVVSGGVLTGDVREFLDVFDTDKDGLVSWDEFRTVLGRAALPLATDTPPKLMGAAASSLDPVISGTVTIELEGGGRIEVDAAKYVAELKSSVARMRSELAKAEGSKLPTSPAATESIGTFLARLPPAELKSLTASVQPEVVDAMKQLVDYVVKETFEADARPKPDTQLEISRDALAQVCMWQLVTGYRLRQAEAKGEAHDRLGF
jgi:Ca2+-binding EF-hand superfamily protein